MSLRTASSAIAAALAAWALHELAPAATPIDRALPAAGVAIIAVSLLVPSRWSAAIQMAVPLLAAAAMTLAGDHQRLLAYGIITGAAFAAALVLANPLDRPRAIAFTLLALVLLRWLPPPRDVFREVLLLLAVTAIVFAFGRRASALSVALAVAIGLITPAFPVRTIALPLGVALVIVLTTWRAGVSPAGRRASSPGGFVDRNSPIGHRAGRPVTAGEDARTPWGNWPPIFASLAVATMLTFYPWSGILARAVPLLPLLPKKQPAREVVAVALAPGEQATLDVPWLARSLVVSAANASRMRRGDLLGTLEPGGITIRIGDCADWGALRRDHFYKSRNPLPRDPAGRLRAYGYAAWIDGAGRIALPPGARRITVRMAPGLPALVRLQLDAFEVEGR